MTDITKLAERFCAWPLPPTVCADQCATNPAYPYPRTGTNLLSVDEAAQMLRHVLAGELDYKAFCEASTDHEADGTLDSLSQTADMIETWGLAELPANEAGQVDFMRAIMDSAVAEIRAFVAKHEAKP